MTKRIIYLHCITLFFIYTQFPLLSAPKAEPWDRWKTNDPSSEIQVDHGVYKNFLETYLAPPGAHGNTASMIKMKYADVSEDDKGALESYIHYLATIPVSRLHRDEQMAYWINLYNALTIRLILDHYPIKSIRDITFSMVSTGPWDKKLITIEKTPVSLNDIEHRILRPLWKDPRIHFAVNCASIGCPDIQEIPFTRENLEELLEKGIRDYINHQRGVSLVKGRLQLSSIFDWYYKDFAKTKRGILSFLIKYADKDVKEILQAYEGSISYS